MPKTARRSRDYHPSWGYGRIYAGSNALQPGYIFLLQQLMNDSAGEQNVVRERTLDDYVKKLPSKFGKGIPIKIVRDVRHRFKDLQPSRNLGWWVWFRLTRAVS
jgi:hypothetical protein